MRLTILLSILALVIGIAACGTPHLPGPIGNDRWSRTVPLEEPATPTKAEAEATGERDAAQRRLDHAERELADAKLALGQAQSNEAAARKEAILAPLRRVAGITAATALVGMLACIALWFILPMGTKRGAVIGGCASLAVLVSAVAFQRCLPYLAFAGGALVISGVAWLIWRLRHTQVGLASVAGSFDHLESAVHAWKVAPTEEVNDLVESVKRAAAREQDRLGLRRLIAGVRSKTIPPPPTPDLAPSPAP